MLQNGSEAAYYRHRAPERAIHHAVAAALNQHHSLH
jgi:hypothetical protein